MAAKIAKKIPSITSIATREVRLPNATGDCLEEARALHHLWRLLSSEMTTIPYIWQFSEPKHISSHLFKMTTIKRPQPQQYYAILVFEWPPNLNIMIGTNRGRKLA